MTLPSSRARRDEVRTAASLRNALGVAAVLLIVGGAVAFLWPDASTGSRLAGGLVARAGVVLGAIWFSWPALRRVNPWVAVVIGLAFAVAVLRPRLLLVIIPAAAVIGWLGRTRR